MPLEAATAHAELAWLAPCRLSAAGQAQRRGGAQVRRARVRATQVEADTPGGRTSWRSRPPPHSARKDARGSLRTSRSPPSPERRTPSPGSCAARTSSGSRPPAPPALERRSGRSTGDTGRAPPCALASRRRSCAACRRSADVRRALSRAPATRRRDQPGRAAGRHPTGRGRRAGLLQVDRWRQVTALVPAQRLEEIRVCAATDAGRRKEMIRASDDAASRAPAQFSVKRASVPFTPSVALRKANAMPARATASQSTAPCQL